MTPSHRNKHGISLGAHTLQHMALRSLMTHGLFSIRAPRLTMSLRQTLFLQAVIDDHREIVAQILDSEPRRVAFTAIRGSTITSFYTWQTFEAEYAFTMTIVRGQFEMAKLLLFYLNRLPQTPRIRQIIENGLARWSQCKTYAHQLVIPIEHQLRATKLIKVFQLETFPYKTQKCWNQFCDRTEIFLTLLSKKLVPETPIALVPPTPTTEAHVQLIKTECYVNSELFLLALYKAYFEHFDEFKNEEQRIAFCVLVIGFVQGTLSPEVAKIFCESFSAVIGHEQAISPRAQALKLPDSAVSEKDFYRCSPHTRPTHYSGMTGIVPAGCITKKDAESSVTCMQTYFQQKEKRFIKMILDEEENKKRYNSLEEPTESASNCMY